MGRSGSAIRHVEDALSVVGVLLGNRVVGNWDGSDERDGIEKSLLVTSRYTGVSCDSADFKRTFVPALACMSSIWVLCAGKISTMILKPLERSVHPATLAPFITVLTGTVDYVLNRNIGKDTIPTPVSSFKGAALKYESSII